MPGGKVFISYRRGDTAGHAGRLFDNLAGRFGRTNVFMDLDSILPGVNYEQRIYEAIGGCDVALVLLGDEWQSVTGSDGRRRLDDEHDWVRLEVQAALQRNDVAVVPVLVEGARMPAADQLPEPLRGLASLNATELSDSRWRYDVEQLVAAIERRIRRGWIYRFPRSVRVGLPALAVVGALAVTLAATGVFSGGGGPAPSPQPPQPLRLLPQNFTPATGEQLDSLPRTVTPGHSIGPVTLGDDAAHVQRALGLGGGRRHGDVRHAGSLSWELGSLGALQVNFDARGKAEQIIDTSGLFQLDGISLDAGLAGVRRALGPSWRTLRCHGFTAIYLDSSATGPSTVWLFGPGRHRQLLVQNFELYPGNAVC